MKSCIIGKIVAFVCLTAAVTSAPSAFGLATESGIRKKHAPGEYVYTRSINGYDLTCYDGDTEALNGYLQKRDDSTYRLILRPGPSAVTTLVEQSPVPCTWTFEDGTDSTYVGMPGYKDILDASQLITIYVDEKIQLDELKIPSQIRIAGLDIQKAIFKSGLCHADDNVRGQSARQLARLDPYDPNSVALLIGLLTDKSPNVNSDAAWALSEMGNCAESSLPNLRVAHQQASRYRESFERAIAKLDERNDTTDAEREFRAHYKAIVDFVIHVERSRTAQSK